MQPSAPNATNRVFPNEHGETEPGPDQASGPAPAAADGSGGRDGRGRFARGNPGGPGNPFTRRVALLRQALLAAVTAEDLEAVARRLVARAREGDTAAAKLLLSYTLGKSAAAVDPDTLDVQEWQLYRQRPVAGQDLLRVLTNLPADAACAILRAALPGVADGMLRLLAEGLARQAQEEQDAAERPRRAQPRRRPTGAPAAEAEEGPAAPEAEKGAPGDGPVTGSRSEERPPAPPAQGDAPPGAARASRKRLPPADADPEYVETLRERDTELRRELQTLLAGLDVGEGSSPRAPMANGANGARRGPPTAEGA
jgi:hypothetical protein